MSRCVCLSQIYKYRNIVPISGKNHSLLWMLQECSSEPCRWQRERSKCQPEGFSFPVASRQVVLTWGTRWASAAAIYTGALGWNGKIHAEMSTQIFLGRKHTGLSFQGKWKKSVLGGRAASVGECRVSGCESPQPVHSRHSAYIHSHRACKMKREAKGKIPERPASKEHKRFHLKQAGKWGQTPVVICHLYVHAYIHIHHTYT